MLSILKFDLKMNHLSANKIFVGLKKKKKDIAAFSVGLKLSQALTVSLPQPDIWALQEEKYSGRVTSTVGSQ